jgi:hypothetical protein
MQKDAAIPADLLELKARLEAWRLNRKYEREPLSVELRQAALEMSQRYPPSLVRRILKLDPWRLKKSAANKPAPTRSKPQTAFFTLPPETTLPDLQSSASPTAAGYRLQLERPDGARLTLTLSAFDLTSTRQICADFLRGASR